MHDINFIRQNPEAFDKGLNRRGVDPLSSKILEIDERRRKLLTDLQSWQARRNEASKLIGQVMAQKDTEKAEALKAEVAGLKTQVQEGEEAERAIDVELKDILAAYPNLPADDVPDGLDEEANQEVRRHGQAPEVGNAPREHFDLGEALGQMDFEQAAKVSGSRFVFLSKHLARMERALASFMLDSHVDEFGFQEVVPPMLVNEEAMFGTGQLPKFREDQYCTEDGFWLVPTAEVPLTNMARERIIAGEELPWRLTAYTPCFRQEAGSAGRDTRGMIRMHQFSKVELVTVCTPEKSLEEHDHMVEAAETILKKLGLHFRTMLLCAGDMGFSATKTYDLEVWLPGQGRFREISSVSNCLDFQARRMNARFRPAGEQKGAAFAHTLNGSGLAVGRTLIAIMENYQQADGSILIPEALVPYMGGMTKILAA